jgi:pentatricopeptide repeat protein
MHKKEIQLFTEALQLAKDEFYLDAIEQLNVLITSFKKSELIDDALYNIGLCYFKMNQFEQAIIFFKIIIEEHPEGLISVLDGGNEFGKTAAKSWFGILNCHLAKGRLDEAKEALEQMERYDNSYIINKKNKKVSFIQLGTELISNYKQEI